MSEKLVQSTAEKIPDLHLDEREIESIEREMDTEFGSSWGFHDAEFARPENTNESDYLISGTLNLIKQVVEAQKSESPYSSIVFLDKSARPGSYFYRQVLKDMTLSGLLDEDISMPEVKFVDVGKIKEQNKIKSENTAEILKSKLPEKALAGKTGKVLVVDEFQDTGSTLTNAKAELAQIYPNLTIDGTYQFKKGVAPFWYRNNELKMVRDSEHTERTRILDRAIVENDAELFSSLQTTAEEVSALSALTKLPRPVFMKLFAKRSRDMFSENEKETPVGEFLEILENEVPRNYSNASPEEILSGVEALSKTKIMVQPGSFYDYFRYAGGRLAAPYINNMNETPDLTETPAYHLRTMLKTLAHKTVKTLSKGD